MLPSYDAALVSKVNRSRPYFPGRGAPAPAFPGSPQGSGAARASRPDAAGSVVLKKLAPSAPGARRHAERFGDALVCVRYREDAANGRRLTTVELIVDERPLPGGDQWVRVGYAEAELRASVKEAGGQWDARRKLWRLSRAAVRKLKLADRIVPENA
jgi:hypothetical protein